MTALTVITDTAKMEELKKAATSGQMRKVFADTNAFMSSLSTLTPLATAANIPIKVAPPTAFMTQDDDGNAQPIEGIRPTIAVVGQRKEVKGADGKGKSVVGIKAFVAFPLPTLDAFLADEEGRKWLDKIAEKEAAHVIFRPLRNAETAEELDKAEIPLTVAEIVMSAREGSVDTDWFDAVWPQTKEIMKQKMSKLHEAMPKSKAEVVKALRSRSYALGMYETLEKANAFHGAIAAFLRRTAEVNKTEDGTPDPIDASELDNWLAKRDELTLAVPTAPDYSSIAGEDFSQVDIGF